MAEKRLTQGQRDELYRYGTLRSKMVSGSEMCMDAESAVRLAKQKAAKTNHIYVVTVFVAPDGETVNEFGRLVEG